MTATIDLSRLNEDEQDFLKEWAGNLGVPIEDLLIQIVSATCDGDQYVEGRPR